MKKIKKLISTSLLDNAERMADEGSRDVRDCVRLARLGRNKEEVDKFLETMRRYR